jgi:hypothetical protein
MGPFSDGWTEADVDAVIARADPAELLYVPIAVSMDPPSRVWAERICVQLAAHEDPNVRCNALLGFAHLARIFRSLNQRVVQPIIEAGLRDPSEHVRNRADDVATDIEWYIGWVFADREDRRAERTCPREKHKETR